MYRKRKRTFSKRRTYKKRSISRKPRSVRRSYARKSSYSRRYQNTNSQRRHGLETMIPSLYTMKRKPHVSHNPKQNQYNPIRGALAHSWAKGAFNDWVGHKAQADRTFWGNFKKRTLGTDTWKYYGGKVDSALGLAAPFLANAFPVVGPIVAADFILNDGAATKWTIGKAWEGVRAGANRFHERITRPEPLDLSKYIVPEISKTPQKGPTWGTVRTEPPWWWNRKVRYGKLSDMTDPDGTTPYVNPFLNKLMKFEAEKQSPFALLQHPEMKRLERKQQRLEQNLRKEQLKTAYLAGRTEAQPSGEKDLTISILNGEAPKPPPFPQLPPPPPGKPVDPDPRKRPGYIEMARTSDDSEGNSWVDPFKVLTKAVGLVIPNGNRYVDPEWNKDEL